MARASSKSPKGNIAKQKSTKQSCRIVTRTKPQRKPNVAKKPAKRAPKATIVDPVSKPSHKAIAVEAPQAAPGFPPTVITFGKHKGKAWGDVPKSYLEWIVNARLPDAQQACSELNRRNIKPRRNIRIAPAAIDAASLKLRDHWDNTRGTFEGLYAWLVRLCDKAIDGIPGPALIEADSVHVVEGIGFEFSAYFDEREHPTRRAGIQLDMIHNPKAGISWNKGTRVGMARAAYADARRPSGVGVW